MARDGSEGIFGAARGGNAIPGVPGDGATGAGAGSPPPRRALSRNAEAFRMRVNSLGPALMGGAAAAVGGGVMRKAWVASVFAAEGGIGGCGAGGRGPLSRELYAEVNAPGFCDG
jgi:hypothetical protein